MSVITERLQDAIAKGDVAELEVAITAAQSALEDGIYRSGPRGKTSGSLAALLSKAKDIFLNNLEDCKMYLKPLRKACRQLDERAIFEALVRTQAAAERVQLCMYTDIRRAEELRESVVAAHEEAIGLLDSDNWQLIDEFLNERAAVLEDRTVLALVQRREDLLRGGAYHRPSAHSRSRSRSRSPQLAGPYTRSSAATCRGSAGSGGPPHDASASSNFLALPDSDDGAGDAPDLRASPVEEPYGRLAPAWRSTVAAPSASAPPPLRSSSGAARFPLRQLIAREIAQRGELATDESARRVELYRAAMLSAAAAAEAGEDSADDDESLVAHAQPYGGATAARTSPATAAVAVGDDADEVDGAPPEPRPAPPRASSSPLELERPGVGAATDSGLPFPAAYLLLSGGDAGSSTGTQAARSPVRSRLSRTPAQQRQQRQVPSTVPREPARATGLPPPAARMLTEHITPNISPIRNTTNTTMTSERQEASTGGLVGLLTRPAHSRGILRGPTRAPSSSSTGAAAATTPKAAATVSVTPDATVGNTQGTTSEVPRSYEARRREILLRSVLEEEDLHRRDLEGTEDFDRCVFLHPMAARGDMLRRADRDRKRMISQ